MGDPRLMSMQQRYETWADHASVVLLETAAVHQTAITHADLAARVQERSGVRTEVPFRSWLGKVLTIVGRRTREAGEPELVSLVVQADGAVGPMYDAVLVACGDAAPGPGLREQAAAEARLECNRRYAPAVTEDAQPLLRPITTVDTSPERASQTARTNPARQTARPSRAPRVPKEPKASRASRSAKAEEPAPVICPRCFLQLPLSGICPNCD
ncbi:hypothetical protein ACF3NS_06085 [Arsenicicoccus cauae]|uniref:hypothetical protein n=1 Tax=Arsenicicoccus cauae TaxID=2663847 RepID=UPI0025939874|nr:hypothetical protein [uncultured Arsenicicoccus sp.]